jgi:hypothetical protein
VAHDAEGAAGGALSPGLEAALGAPEPDARRRVGAAPRVVEVPPRPASVVDPVLAIESSVAQRHSDPHPAALLAGRPMALSSIPIVRAVGAAARLAVRPSVCRHGGIYLNVSEQHVSTPSSGRAPPEYRGFTIAGIVNRSYALCDMCEHWFEF